MAQPWASRFYRSKQWQGCRNAYFTEQHGICEVCGEPGTVVHHLTPLTPENINDPMISLSWENLQLLCCPCATTTRRHSWSWRATMPPGPAAATWT
ncbi:HNH endonuclease [Eubacteriales bacterium OttesenSCG-928-A19]|nr:HNH endonuclease [Eubacteriales bacterium OttesenSCG-928-A19]